VAFATEVRAGECSWRWGTGMRLAITLVLSQFPCRSRGALGREIDRGGYIGQHASAQKVEFGPAVQLAASPVSADEFGLLPGRCSRAERRGGDPPSRRGAVHHRIARFVRREALVTRNGCIWEAAGHSRRCFGRGSPVTGMVLRRQTQRRVSPVRLASCDRYLLGIPACADGPASVEKSGNQSSP
jgi:hypothetical protein